MIKRTLYFGNPAYLSLKLGQLVITLPKPEDSSVEKKFPMTIPIEDIGTVILDNRQITISQALIAELLDNNCALITCAENHLPTGLMLPLYGHTLQNERFRQQIESSLPLKKQLWQQTIKYKILNQASVLEHATGHVHKNMILWSQKVNSGDTNNLEARAAAYYWKTIFQDPTFTRGQFEGGINPLLNYGYAILRAIIARSLVSSGLLPTLGIHHHNRYDAYCLADDIMEPYRPYVDLLVLEIMEEKMISPQEEIMLTTDIKKRLLSIPVLDTKINGKASPLSIAATTTCSSLVKCFEGSARTIAYPELK